MSSTETPASAAAADLRALADFTHHHGEYGAEIAAAVHDIHLILHAPHPTTPLVLAELVARETGGQVHAEPLHVDRAFDTAEVSLPRGVITLSIHRLRNPFPPIPADGPVSFDQPDEATRLRATLANVADELRGYLSASNPQALYVAREALTHRLRDIEGQR